MLISVSTKACRYASKATRATHVCKSFQEYALCSCMRLSVCALSIEGAIRESSEDNTLSKRDCSRTELIAMPPHLNTLSVE